MTDPTLQYMIKDAQGSVFGPASIATVRIWVAEGRILPTMLIAPQGTPNWIEVATHPELADLFTNGQPTTQPNPYQSGPATMPPLPISYPSSLPRQYSGTNGFATWSAILSLFGFLMNLLGRYVACCCCLGFVPGILGLIFGLIGYSQIKSRAPAQSGSGLAKLGILLGILSILLLVAWCCIDLPAIIRQFHAGKGGFHVEATPLHHFP